MHDQLANQRGYHKEYRDGAALDAEVTEQVALMVAVCLDVTEHDTQRQHARRGDQGQSERIVAGECDVKLDGKSALAYVRQRKGLPRGDFDRAERQRLVMKAIVDKVASKQTLSDPGKLLGVIKTMSKSVTVDDSLTNKRILSLVQELQVTSGEDIEHLQVPVGGFGTSKAGASYVKLDKAGMAKLSDALNNGRMNDYGN